MSRKLQFRHLLAQLRTACLDVESFIAGMSVEEFLTDLKTQRAVMMTFVIIAEIADRLRQEEPTLPDWLATIPWIEIRGMRNRLVHGYLHINLNTLWATASVSIPELRSILEAADRNAHH